MRFAFFNFISVQRFLDESFPGGNYLSTLLQNERFKYLKENERK